MPEIADVVIVGCGILGVALAYELAQRSQRVVLLETQGPANGATGSGFAWVNATSKVSNEDNGAYHRLNALGLTHYSRLTAEHGAESPGVHGGGALFWIGPQNADGAAHLRRSAAALRALEYPATLLDRAEMQALEPRAHFPDGAVGLFAPADLWIDTPRLARFYIDGALRHNVDLRLHCPAIGFTRSVTGAISTVETPNGRIATRLLVIAAGIETPKLAAMVVANAAPEGENLDPVAAAWFVPVRREPGLLVETPTGSAPGLAHRILYPPDTAGLHLRPTPGGGLLIGADDADTAVANSASHTLPSELPADLLRRAATALPALGHYVRSGQVDARVCVRPVPADGLPIVGPIPGVPGAYVAVTHSGITLGPLLAHLLTEEIVVGKPSALLAPYRPARFH